MKPRDGPAAELTETIMTAKTKSQPSAKARTVQPVAALTKANRLPTLRLYRVLGDGDGASWAPIGAAWPHKDSKGFSLSFDAVPLTGRVVLRVITPKDGVAAGGQQ